MSPMMAKRVPVTASAFSHRRRFRPCGWVQGSVGSGWGWSPPVWGRWPAGLWWGGVPFGGFGPGLDLGGLGDFGALGGAGDCALLGVLPPVHDPDLGAAGSFRDHDGVPEDELAIEVLGGLSFAAPRPRDCATETKTTEEIVTLAVRLRPLDFSDSCYVPEFEDDPDGASEGRENPEDDRLLPCSPPPPPPLLRCRKPRRPER